MAPKPRRLREQRGQLSQQEQLQQKTQSESSFSVDRNFHHKLQRLICFFFSLSSLGLNRPNSSEQQELERIRSLQREVALHRKRNEASFKAALAGSESTGVSQKVLGQYCSNQPHLYFCPS